MISSPEASVATYSALPTGLFAATPHRGRRRRRPLRTDGRPTRSAFSTSRCLTERGAPLEGSRPETMARRLKGQTLDFPYYGGILWRPW